MTIEFKSFPRSENKEHFFTVSALFFAVREFCYAKKHHSEMTKKPG